jgi:hypothetical protein
VIGDPYHLADEGGSTMAFMSPGPQESPFELEMLARQEREARGRLDAARARKMDEEGVVPHEHHALIRKLEAEWKQAKERLHRARRPG